MFETVSTAGTGLQTYHAWLDVIADNIANVNDSAPTSGQVFHTHFVHAQAIGAGPNGMSPDSAGAGVELTAVTQSAQNGELVQDPSNPMADRNGNIRRADVNLSDQMGEMIMAQRAFQANASVVDRAKETYEAAINIGKGI